jgi:peptidoglycan/LPS O-acetylase OafA/YrhL
MTEVKGLTSLRGIAALAVVLQHFSTTAQSHAQGVIPSLVPHGYIAVDFFFVLSGYIMCYTYLASFQRSGWSAYFPFLMKRLIRLLPLNAFVTCVFLLLAAASTALLGRNIFFGAIEVPYDIIINLLMLQGLGLGHNMNGPSWSVSVELVAYMLLPVLIFGVFSARRWLVGLCGLAALGGLLYVALSNRNLGLTSSDAYYGGLRCVTQFTLGMLAFRLGQTQRFQGWLAQDRTALLAMGAGLVLLLCRIDLLTALTFPFIVVTTAFNRSRVSAGLSRPWVHELGNISFSLYLIHEAFRPAWLLAVKTLHPAPLGTAPSLAWAFVASLSVLPFAWLAFHYVEKPSKSWLLKRFMARPAVAVS